MSKGLTLICCIIVMAGCQSHDKSDLSNSIIQSKHTIEYPVPLIKVFDKHGGLDQWHDMRAMNFEIVKEEGKEITYVDLKNRREMIEANNFTMGYDGTQHWADTDTSYKGNPVFYKNLMFYFFAMPFVLADEGITYTKVDDLVFEGINYPGYKISYGAGIGESPEDEYFMHYDEQNQMAWLGYTVTYFSKEKAAKISWIRYDDWAIINGLVLPKTLSWYQVENNQPTELRNKREFVNVMVTEKPFDDQKFEKIESAEYVE